MQNSYLLLIGGGGGEKVVKIPFQYYKTSYVKENQQ